MLIRYLLSDGFLKSKEENYFRKDQFYSRFLVITYYSGDHTRFSHFEDSLYKKTLLNLLKLNIQKTRRSVYMDFDNC